MKKYKKINTIRNFAAIILGHDFIVFSVLRDSREWVRKISDVEKKVRSRPILL